MTTETKNYGPANPEIKDPTTIYFTNTQKRAFRVQIAETIRAEKLTMKEARERNYSTGWIVRINNISVEGYRWAKGEMRLVEDILNPPAY